MDSADTEARLIDHIRSHTSPGMLKAWAGVRGVGEPFQGLDADGNARVWREYQEHLEALSQIELWVMP